MVKANKLEKIYNDKYFKEQLYLRLIRLIKMKKRKNIFNLIRLKKSAKFYDKVMTFRQLLYIYKSTLYT